ncbi:MAG: radical SAM protein [Desulfomonilaceae bacterium]|nr:radical SAM protein [Desulfomonilaceae bacterium]
MSFLFINVNHDVGFESSESIPISTGYILAALKSAGWKGIILDDLLDRPLTLRSLEMWIRRVDPQVIGFTAYQSTMHRIRFLCRYIKSRHRHIHVVLGGPQAISMPSQALEALVDVDALVRGEAEVVMLEMAAKLNAGEDLESVRGISCKCKGRIVDTGPGPDRPEDLDVYPSPYLTETLNLEGKDTAILLSSRGCRHVCRFCITPSICKGKIRYHSIERVTAEMEMLAGQGIGRFWFADPNFTDDRDRTERLLAEKIRRSITTRFWCQTRSDLVDAAMLKKLSDAGADTIAFGLESGSPGVLKQTNKGIELEQLAENIRVAKSLGLSTELFSIFGLPGETVADARQTMEFVRSLDIPIESNSGSQQMQLYFGSIYEKNPERYGFRPLPVYRPSYFSVGDQYETTEMHRDDIRKVRNMWVLANEQMKLDVYYKQRIFEILDFLLSNRRDLELDPVFHAYGTLACSAIEEFELMKQFLSGYERVCSDDDMPVEELISALGFFKETDQPAGSMDRVIFDSRSYIDGVPFTGISGKYWDVLLGRGLLLASFEEGLIGVSGGEETSFTFGFPEDYHQEELRGKEVEVQAKVHKVFKTLQAGSIEEIRSLDIRNQYHFSDLDVLKDQNEILYYLTLRDIDPTKLARTPSHFLTLVHKLSKLGKREEIENLAHMLESQPKALNALADTLSASGKCLWALEYYEKMGNELPTMVLKRVRCLLNSEKAHEAMELLATIPEVGDLEYQEILLACLKAARPDSQRIPSLDHHVMDLRVVAALDRQLAAKSGAHKSPILHGSFELGLRE